MSRERSEELRVWKIAYDLSLRVYTVTAQFPAEEKFGLAQQLRRAAVGIFANLSEGHARGSRREYLQFCTIARGSQAEVRALLRLGKDLGLIAESTWNELNDGYAVVGRMLNKLVNALRGTPAGN